MSGPDSSFKSPPLLAAHQLCKHFQSPQGRMSVLDGIDLAVHAGESLSIQGESGSGKTTLLYVLAGLEQPDAGRVYWEGRELNHRHLQSIAAQRMHFLGLIFQAYYLIPELNAIENVLLTARLMKQDLKIAREQAQYWLTQVGLEKRMYHLPSQLSGGERQRVAIARAFIGRPQLILADEPTGNLDEKTAQVVFDLMLSLTQQEKIGLLLVTHSCLFASRTDRSLKLHLGRFC